MKIKFRQKGEIVIRDFSGDVVVAGEKAETTKLPLRDNILDLSHLPVVTIGGKKGRRQDARLAEFEQQAPDFKGVIYLLPYSWANGWSDGHLYIPSWDALLDKSKRISGGRPEVQLTNYRWLSDGRYAADRARMLHGKAIEILNAEVEQVPQLDDLVREISNWHGHIFPHPLRGQCLTVWRELYDLEKRRTVFSGEPERDMVQLVRDKLTEKFRKSDIRKVADIPSNFSISSAEVAPDITAQAETLGIVEVPGVGRKLAHRQRPDFGYNEVPVVTLSLEELRQVTSWPFSDVYPMVTELGAAFEQLGYEIRDALQVPETERLGLLRNHFAKRWADIQRGKNYPKDIEIANPRETDLPAKPDPVQWGYDLLTGGQFTAYAGLSKLHGYGERWAYRWFDSEEAAAKTDAPARQEAESYITARKLEAQLTAEAKMVELPLPLPEAFASPADPDPAEIMQQLGFTPKQFRFEGEGPNRYVIPGDSYFSELRQRSVQIGPDRHVAEWFQREGNVIVIYANITIRELLGDEREGWCVAEDMGAEKEAIQAVRNGIAAERKQAEANYRETVRKFVEALRAHPTYACLCSDMRAKLQELRELFIAIPDISKIADELRLEWTKAEVIRRKNEQGEILANFGGHFRVMGAAGQCQYWVIQPNGIEREPDEVEYRKRYSSEGSKRWRIVGPEELALSWSKSNTAADHEFAVEKLPAGGCTAEQLATVERLEREIGERFEGAVGISGKVSPSIGKGWGLGRPKPAQKPESTTEPTPTSAEPVSPSKVDLSKLFGGAAKVRK